MVNFTRMNRLGTFSRFIAIDRQQSLEWNSCHQFPAKADRKLYFYTYTNDKLSTVCLKNNHKKKIKKVWTTRSQNLTVWCLVDLLKFYVGAQKTSPKPLHALFSFTLFFQHEPENRF